MGKGVNQFLNWMARGGRLQIQLAHDATEPRAVFLQRRLFPQISISNPQQFLPLSKVALEPDALGDLERRDQTSFDLLATFSGMIAR